MDKKEIYNMCKEFADKIREKIVSNTARECSLYKTTLVKNMVIEESNDEFKDIITHITEIARILNRVLGEK